MTTTPSPKKATASPRAWLAHQKKNYQLHSKLTQIEGIVKTHLAKVNFDREALDMDIRYISEPEKVEAERKAKEEAAETERKALAKREAAREKARLKAEEKKHKEDEKNRLIWSFLIQFVDDIKSGARKIGSADYSAGSCKAWKSYKVFMKVSTLCTSLNGLTLTELLWLVISTIYAIMGICLRLSISI